MPPLVTKYSVFNTFSRCDTVDANVKEMIGPIIVITVMNRADECLRLRDLISTSGERVIKMKPNVDIQVISV